MLAFRVPSATLLSLLGFPSSPGPSVLSIIQILPDLFCLLTESLYLVTPGASSSAWPEINHSLRKHYSLIYLIVKALIFPSLSPLTTHVTRSWRCGLLTPFSLSFLCQLRPCGLLWRGREPPFLFGVQPLPAPFSLLKFLQSDLHTQIIALLLKNPNLTGSPPPRG